MPPGASCNHSHMSRQSPLARPVSARPASNCRRHGVGAGNDHPSAPSLAMPISSSNLHWPDTAAIAG
eukprot:2912865-Pyramimonas_sp.AAC.1